MKRIFFAFTLLLFISNAFAQRPAIEQYKKEIQLVNKYLDEQNIKAALKELRRIDSLSPNDANINYNIGKLYLMMPSNKPLAIGYLSKALMWLIWSYLQ